MSGENCLVCASDEGVFLDVKEQPLIKLKAKNCQLGKVSEEGPSTKVCYKCAFEIEQCNTFVEKIKRVDRTQSYKRICCVLCLDAYNKDVFFDLSKQKNGVNNFEQRIQNLFEQELIIKEFQKKFICLSCRYCVDLLADLRNLSDEVSDKLKTIIKNGINPADLPKTKTSIVNRKTTFIQSSNLDLNTPSDTDSESSSIMGSRRKVNKGSKPTGVKPQLQRKCQQCKTLVKNDVDMYRIYRTGVTVCKQCWVTIDPGKTPSKKRKKIVYPETKLCSVLLKDLYQTKDEKEYKIEKDKKGNTIFIITESESRTKPKTNKTKSNNVEDIKTEQVETKINSTKSTISGKTRRTSEQSTQDEIEVRLSRNRQRKESEQSTQEEVEVKSRTSRRRKESEQSTQESIEIKSTRTSRRRKESEQSAQEAVEDNKSSRSRRESEQSVQEIKPTRTTRKRKDSEQSIQDIEIKTTRNNRTRKTSEESVQESTEKKSTRGARRKKDSGQSSHEDTEIDVDVDSDSGPSSKKAKKSSAKTEPKQNSKSKSSNQSSTSEVSTRKRGRSSSIESSGSVRKSARNAKKNIALDLEEIIEIDDDSDSNKVQKENISTNEEEPRASKRRRKEKSVSADEHSDAESSTSEIKIRSKRSSSVSSKESTSTSKFKTPSVKDGIKGTKSNKTKSLKSLDIDTSESEEIDILKSTDEETKEESVLDIESQEKDGDTKTDDAESKTNMNEIEVTDEATITPTEKTDLKHEKMNSHVENDLIQKNEDELIDESLESIKENEKSKDEETTDESLKLQQEDSTKSLQDVSGAEKDTNSADDEKQNTAVETIDNADNDIVVADIEENENNIEVDDENVSVSSKDNKSSSSKRSSSSKPRNAKSSAKRKSEKDGNRKSVDDIVIYDSSDSESSINKEEKIEKSYTCKICDKIYENKFLGLQHELTHTKTLKIRLEKVTLSEKTAELRVNSEEETAINENTIETEEKMEVDDEKPEAMNKTEDQDQISENLNDDKLADSKAVDENAQEIEEPSNENIDIDSIEDKEKEPLDTSNEVEEDITEGKKDNEVAVSDDNMNDKTEGMESDHQSDIEFEKEETNQQSSKQCKKSEKEQESDSKSKETQQTNIEFEDEISMTITSDSDKIAEAVQETLNDMAELHGKIKKSAHVEEVADLNETVKSTENRENDETIVPQVGDTNEDDLNVTPDTEDKNSEPIDIDDVQSKTSKSIDEIIECETLDDDAEVEVEPVTPIVDVDEDSKDIHNVEDEPSNRVEESEIEITEIDDAAATETVKTTDEIECEQVDLTENDEHETPKASDDIEVEDADSHKNVDEDENSVDEINVTAADEPFVENNDENTKQVRNEVEVNNDEDGNNTEEEEALAQESLEELLQRKGLQIIDEFAESVTDGDEDSEKEVNVSSEKENVPVKDAEPENELEIKISDAECTEILEISNKSINKQKDVEGVVGESQIIQDVDVVEEVVHDVDQPHGDVGQEVEVESNGNCLDVANNVVGEVLTEVFSMAAVGSQKHLDLQTEPISDDETNLVPETLENIRREVRNSQDMPSLDPIEDDE